MGVGIRGLRQSSWLTIRPGGESSSHEALPVYNQFPPLGVYLVALLYRKEQRGPAVWDGFMQRFILALDEGEKVASRQTITGVCFRGREL